MPLTDDLISFWELEESSGDRVDAHGANDLSEVNGPISRATGIVGFGVDLDRASNQSLSRADNPSLSLGSDTPFTIAGWVKIETFGATNHCLVGKWANTADPLTIEYFVAVVAANGRGFFAISNGVAFESLETTDTVSAGTWAFIAAWHDPATDEIACQINNGTPFTDVWAGGTFDGGDTFRVGDVETPGVNPFDGMIDQLGFWKRVLTAEELTYLYNNGHGKSYAQVVAGVGSGFFALTRF